MARWTTTQVSRLASSREEALLKKGFTVIQIFSPGPTNYGRRNKLGEGLDEMKYDREHSVIKHFIDPKETDLTLNGEIIVGKFVDIDKQTFLDNQPILSDKQENNLTSHEKHPD